MAYKKCKILDRETGTQFYGQIDTELKTYVEYRFIEIPDDDKEYTPTYRFPFYKEK